MSDAAEPLHLAGFDEIQPVALDPQIWDRNLSALAEVQPDLAARLARTELPPHWQATRTCDGCVTYRTELTGQPPAWLGGSGIPRGRAAALLAAFQPGDSNPTLPTIGGGAELARLLELLPEYRAVYVFEPDLTALAAVLRTVDLATSIAGGRCVFVPPDDEQGFLDARLDAHPGLLPPGNIVVLPDVPPPRLEALRRLCERTVERTLQLRARRLEVLRTRVSAGPAAPPRLALLTLTPERLFHKVAAQLARAAQELGWTALCCAAGGPREVHWLAHCERLVEFSPHLTICLNHAATAVPLALPGTVCEWVLDALDPLASSAPAGALRLAASPRILAALRAAAGANTDVGEWFWGCQPPTTDDNQPPGGTVWLVADRPSAEPEGCGIEQPTHKQLWQAARQQAAAHWESEAILRPEDLVRRAERASGLLLEDAASRAPFVAQVERRLVPAVIAENIERALDDEGLRFQTVGRGWRHWPRPDREVLAENVLELPEEAVKQPPLAVICAAAADPLTPGLLHVAARGWPLLLHSPGGRSPAAALGGLLHPEQHFVPFSGPAELRAALRAVCADPRRARQRAMRARRHVCEHHSYACRLRELWARVNAALPSA